jgi:hypothetical protein
MPLAKIHVAEGRYDEIRIATESSIDVSRPHASGRGENRPGARSDRRRQDSSSLDHPLTILADQGIEIVGIEKKVMVGRVTRSAYWLNHDRAGRSKEGYDPAA